MLKQVLKSASRLQLTRLRLLSSETVATTSPPQKWDLFAAVALERLPVVSKSLNAFESEYMTMLQQIEFENSLKSDHELQHEKDIIHRELIKKGEIDVDMDSISKLTAQDKKDAYNEEFTKFNFAPRLTKDDQAKNLKSVNRQLEDILYLLVEQKLGDQKHFLLPQGKHIAGETLRQTAERAIRETCGSELKTYFYGNAPCGFYKYKYPKTNQNVAVGAKIFFFRSAYSAGNVSEGSFQWLDKEALSGKLHKSYRDAIKQFLL